MCEVGCNFGSMNIDEFMRNIRNVEEFQAATGGGLVGMEEAPVVGAGGSGGGEDAGGIGLCWQWSFSLPLSLCWKMVDEQRPKINRDPQPVHAQPQVACPAQQLPVQPMVGNGKKTFCTMMLPSGNKSAIDCSRQDACRWDHFILIFCYTLEYTIKI